MRKLKLGSTLFSILLCVVFITTHEAYAFDFVKKLIYPVEYWEDQVSKDEEMLKFYRKQIMSCQLEFNKLRQTKEIIFRQNILDGMTPEEARDDFQKEWEANVATYKTMTELYDMEKADLAKAKTELQNARNKK